MRFTERDFYNTRLSIRKRLTTRNLPRKRFTTKPIYRKRVYRTPIQHTEKIYARISSSRDHRCRPSPPSPRGHALLLIAQKGVSIPLLFVNFIEFFQVTPSRFLTLRHACASDAKKNLTLRHAPSDAILFRPSRHAPSEATLSDLKTHAFLGNIF